MRGQANCTWRTCPGLGLSWRRREFDWFRKWFRIGYNQSGTTSWIQWPQCPRDPGRATRVEAFHQLSPGDSSRLFIGGSTPCLFPEMFAPEYFIFGQPRFMSVNMNFVRIDTHE